MRILYHHRTLADGAEGIHIAEMVSAFRSLGHEVRVAGLAVPAAAAPHGGAIRRIRRALPGPFYELGSVACNALEYRAVRRALTDFRPDFLYKRHARSDVAALAAARHRGVQAVLEVNCLYSARTYRQFEPLTFTGLAERFEKRALALASEVIAVSSPLAEDIARLADRRDVHVLPNGANPDAFDPTRVDRAAARTRLGISDHVAVGWAGILREWHGLELLLDVIAQHPRIVAVVIGDGPGRAALASRAAELRLGKRLIMTGRVPHELMPACLAALDIAVVPDERTGVASPMKLLEYMAMALPVIAPDLENIQDIVTHEAEGLLFRPDDGDALSCALLRLIGEPELRARLGANGRRKICQQRNWTRNAEAVLDLVAGHASRTSLPVAGSLEGQHV
jgi:glycosyltransferase involved in cell wall biosynthesis